MSSKTHSTKGAFRGRFAKDLEAAFNLPTKAERQAELKRIRAQMTPQELDDAEADSYVWALNEGVRRGIPTT